MLVVAVAEISLSEGTSELLSRQGDPDSNETHGVVCPVRESV